MGQNAVVSVLVLTYNPNKDKLFDTINSILFQQKIKIQIVISDDGSVENYFENIERYLYRMGFDDYKLIASKKNQGIVRNTLEGVNACDGKYIKTISPGDCLTQKDILFEWVEHIRNSGKRWSIGDSIYYQKDGLEKVKFVSHQAHPLIVDAYQEQREKECIWNYVVLNDVALGAAILCERNTFKTYLERIAGKVIYGEDTAFRLMMFDGIVADYFPVPVIFYEYGLGVSTSGEETWHNRIVADWNTSEKIMSEDTTQLTEFQMKMVRVFEARQKRRGCRKIFMELFVKGKIRMAIIRRIRGRYTPTKIDIEKDNMYTFFSQE